MKLGIYANAFTDLPLREVLKKIHLMGADMVEIASGEEGGTPHIDTEELLANPDKLREFKALLDAYDLKLSAISCHGNPVSPRDKVRELSVKTMKNAVLVAEKMGLDRIVGFSGCPGDCETASYASWVTVNWPPDYREVLKWQWEKKLIPFWTEFVSFAKDHGVDKIALELHPGFSVYNPKSLKKLRSHVGDAVGANLDLSHIIWQRMDPIAVIRELHGMINYFHAKDVSFDPIDSCINGMITTTDYVDPANRPFNFRIVGYGNGPEFWRKIFAELRKQGYDYVASIELECELFDTTYGTMKAVEFLKEVMLFDSIEVKDKWIHTIEDFFSSQNERYGV